MIVSMYMAKLNRNIVETMGALREEKNNFRG
jgi:hypothetical protein